jgi:Stress responsive A/B Barrel Domain
VLGQAAARHPISVPGVLHHVVLVTLRDHITDAEVEAVLEGFASLPPAISQIRSYEFGRDAGLTPNDFGVVLVATFDTVEDFQTYREHPAHVAFRRDLLVPASAAITSTQFLA